MQREDTRQRIMGRDDKNSTISLTNCRQERHQDERLFGWNLSLFAMAKILFTSTCLLVTSPVLAATIKFCPPIKYNIDVDKVGLCRADGSFSTWDCGQCPPGLGLSVECGRIYKQGTKIQCDPCKRGHTYSDKNDIGQCKPCTRCQENEIIKSGECKSDKDTIKCQCKPGFYRDTWEHCKPCSWCCGDNSNKHVTECNIPQVPLAKQCSFQTKKSCGPQTTTTSIPSTTPAISTTTAPTAYTRKEELINDSISLDGTSDSNELENTFKDSPKREKKPNGGGSTDTHLVQNILSSFTSVVVLVVVILGGIYYYKRRNRSSGSADSDSSDDGPENSTSTSNVENSSGQLLPKDERGESSKEDDEKIYTMNDTVVYEKGAVKVPLLTTPGVQGRVKDSMPGTSEDVSQISVGQLSKEQKLDLAVKQIPHEIYVKVCEQLDAEDPFFRDYRLLAEQLGVTKKQTDVLPINSTDSLVINRMPKVRRLMDILKKIEREDVMKIIEEWLGQ